MTFNIDGNMVAGADTARFAARAFELMESAFGFDVLKIESSN